MEASKLTDGCEHTKSDELHKIINRELNLYKIDAYDSILSAQNLLLNFSKNPLEVSEAIAN